LLSFWQADLLGLFRCQSCRDRLNKHLFSAASDWLSIYESLVESGTFDLDHDWILNRNTRHAYRRSCFTFPDWAVNLRIRQSSNTRGVLRAIRVTHTPLSWSFPIGRTFQESDFPKDLLTPSVIEACTQFPGDSRREAPTICIPLLTSDIQTLSSPIAILDPAQPHIDIETGLTLGALSALPEMRAQLPQTFGEEPTFTDYQTSIVLSWDRVQDHVRVNMSCLLSC
jgi:hypothetical protein